MASSPEAIQPAQSSGAARPVGGNVAKMVDRLSKDLGCNKLGVGGDAVLRKDKLPHKNRARVRFSYSPKHEDELRLNVDEVIEVFGEAEEGWLRGNLNGKVGVFPANFVETFHMEDEQDSKHNILEHNGATDCSSHEEASVIQPKKIKGVGFGVDILGGGGAVKLRSLKSSTDKGEERKTTIEFVDKDGSKKEQTSVSEVLESSKCAKESGEYAKVEFAYNADNDDELKLAVGDIVLVLSKESEDPGWWYGEVNGKKGVFPDNFVKLLPPEQVSKDRKIIPHQQPPAVPAKPKPAGSSNTNRSTTPEPHKSERVVDMGSKANSLKTTPTTSSTFPPSGLSAADSKIDGSGVLVPPERPKKPVFAPNSPGLTKPKVTQANPPGGTTTTNNSSSYSNTVANAVTKNAFASVKKEKDPEETQNQLPCVQSDRLNHPTASRPKHRNKRPPSQVFLAQMGGKDAVSPTSEDPPQPSSILPVKKPVRPPPPAGSSVTTDAGTNHLSKPSETRLKQDDNKMDTPQTSDAIANTKSADPLLQLRKEFEAYKQQTDAKIQELERQLAKITQGVDK